MVKGFISDERPTHHIDFTYFYYLPFSIIFTSDDNLHKKYAPMLMQGHQRFIERNVLKQGLAELVEYYYSLPEGVLNTGYANYAEYPPLDGAFIISKIYDDCCGYDWRAYATQPKEPRGPEADTKLFEGIKEWQDLYKQQYPEVEEE